MKQRQQQWSPEAVAGKEVMIVEDDPDTQRILADVFSNQGWLIDQAYTGHEGVGIGSHLQPDLILLDVHMPGIDGLSMLKKLYKRNSLLRRVPVIILSNMRLDEQEIRDFVGNQNLYYMLKLDTSLERLAAKAGLLVGGTRSG